MAGRRRRWLHGVVVAAALVPLALLAARFAAEGLGANPIEEITHLTGEWCLRLLLASLAVTPARRLLGLAWLVPLRRTLGLLAFGYGVLHGLTYVALDQVFDWTAIVEDVRERRFVTAGVAALLCLVPPALTSTRAMMRRLGRRWKALHRLVYAAAFLGVVHHLWLVKADLLAPLAHAAVLAGLLAARRWPRPSRSSAAPGNPKHSQLGSSGAPGSNAAAAEAWAPQAAPASKQHSDSE